MRADTRRDAPFGSSTFGSVSVLTSSCLQSNIVREDEVTCKCFFSINVVTYEKAGGDGVVSCANRASAMVQCSIILSLNAALAAAPGSSDEAMLRIGRIAVIPICLDKRRLKIKMNS